MKCRLMVLWWAGGQGRAFANLAFGATCKPLQDSILKAPLGSGLPWVSCHALPCTPMHHVGKQRCRFAWDIASFRNESSTSQEVLKSQATGTFGDTTTTGLWFSDCPGQREGCECWLAITTLASVLLAWQVTSPYHPR